MSYPLVSVIAVGGLTVASYLTIAVTVGGVSWGYQVLFAAMLACTGAMSAWQARNHDRQRAALMDVSRTDPLTGCLNRRGFEERAVAEISAAGRGVREGAVLLLDLDHFKQVNDRTGMPPAMSCCAGSSGRSKRRSARAMRSGAWAATSSRSCSPTSSPPRRATARRA